MSITRKLWCPNCWSAVALQTCPSGDVDEPAHRRGGGRPEGKIDGMDYYGWCELLRSSSL
jgi:hypothetical protein